VRQRNRRRDRASARAGTALLPLAAERFGLTDALGWALGETRERRSAHDWGVILDFDATPVTAYSEKELAADNYWGHMHVPGNDHTYSTRAFDGRLLLRRLKEMPAGGYDL
jgi:hypothetical protein